MACTRERGGFPVAFYLGARTCGRVGRAAWRAAAWVDGFALLVSLRRAGVIRRGRTAARGRPCVCHISSVFTTIA
jgi:hypothetical protein